MKRQCSRRRAWNARSAAGTSVWSVTRRPRRERGVGGIWDDSWRSAGATGNDLKDSIADGGTPSPSNLIRGLNAPDYRSVDTDGLSLNVSYTLAPSVTRSNILVWRHYNLWLNLDSDNSHRRNVQVQVLSLIDAFARAPKPSAQVLTEIARRNALRGAHSAQLKWK